MTAQRLLSATADQSVLQVHDVRLRDNAIRDLDQAKTDHINATLRCVAEVYTVFGPAAKKRRVSGRSTKGMAATTLVPSSNKQGSGPSTSWNPSRVGNVMYSEHSRTDPNVFYSTNTM
jgi:hypothetical protein